MWCVHCHFAATAVKADANKDLEMPKGFFHTFAMMNIESLHASQLL